MRGLRLVLAAALLSAALTAAGSAVRPAPAGAFPGATVDVAGPVTFSPDVRNDDRTEMLQVCEPSGTRRWLRGDVLAVDAGASGPGGAAGARAVNRVEMESYLKGVVPRESPASWGTLGGGAGMHALRAQAVAARSYSAAEHRSDFAQTCHTHACQVSGGRAAPDGAGLRDLEAPPPDLAVADTPVHARTSP